MKFFLRQPAWVLFLVMFFLPVLFIIPMGFMGCTLWQAFVIIANYCIALNSLWVWSIGEFAYKKLPPMVRINLVQFRVAAALTLPIMLGAGCVKLSGLLTPETSNFLLLPYGIYLVLMLYCIAFVSRALRSIEFGRPVSPGTGYDYLPSLLLSPFGVWFLQPKINRMYHGLSIDDPEVDF